MLGNRIVITDPTPVVIAVVEPVLALYKTMPDFAPGTTINPGDTLTFTVIVAHTGASQVTAYDVVITDVLQSDFINATVISAQRSDGLPLTAQVLGQEIRVPGQPGRLRPAARPDGAVHLHRADQPQQHGGHHHQRRLRGVDHPARRGGRRAHQRRRLRG
ncbi:MAG: hypothetical protein V9F04_16975 [Dermatophilaceae bacterium]